MFADRSRYLGLEDRHCPRQRKRAWPPAGADFALALEYREFLPVFQLRVRPCDGTLHSVQGTVRWAHPQLGMLEPQDFLCEADQHGVLGQVAEELIQRGLSAWHYWHLHYGADLPLLSLHLSGAVLRTADTARRFDALLAATGLDRRRVDFECVARPSVLLIDAGRLRDASGNAAARELLACQVENARAKGCSVIAEGVDSLLEWTLVRELACDVAQGDFIALPLPQRELRGALRFWRDSHRAISAADAM